MADAASNGVPQAGGVQSLERALDILEVLGRSEGELGISEIGLSVGLANGTVFRSKLGELAANHLMTVTEGYENLRPLGELCLWEGAQDVLFEKA